MGLVSIITRSQRPFRCSEYRRIGVRPAPCSIVVFYKLHVTLSFRSQWWSFDLQHSAMRPEMRDGVSSRMASE